MKIPPVKHNALALVDCTVYWEFEAPSDASSEQIEEIAWRECPGASLCHQCSDELYVGDVGKLVEIDGELVKP